MKPEFIYLEYKGVREKDIPFKAKVQALRDEIAEAKYRVTTLTPRVDFVGEGSFAALKEADMECRKDSAVFIFGRGYVMNLYFIIAQLMDLGCQPVVLTSHFQDLDGKDDMLRDEQFKMLFGEEVLVEIDGLAKIQAALPADE
jgi:hypothetical protein